MKIIVKLPFLCVRMPSDSFHDSGKNRFISLQSQKLINSATPAAKALYKLAALDTQKRVPIRQSVQPSSADIANHDLTNPRKSKRSIR